MRRKLLLDDIAVALPPCKDTGRRIDRDDIHIRITEAGIQKTSVISCCHGCFRDEQTYT
ncbi:MAG: hypothetical protein ACLR84_06010 [Clostridia bacterium]